MCSVFTWRDPDRNDYVPAETFDTEPVAISAATFAFDKGDFVRTTTGTVDFQNPFSDVAYRVILERRSTEKHPLQDTGGDVCWALSARGCCSWNGHAASAHQEPAVSTNTNRCVHGSCGASPRGVE